MSPLFLGPKVNQARYHWQQMHLLGLFFNTERRKCFPLSRQAISELHGVTTQLTAFCTVTILRTSNSIFQLLLLLKFQFYNIFS
jgi:hypothetical protein